MALMDLNRAFSQHPASVGEYLHRTPRERGMLRHPHGARRYRLPGARHPAVLFVRTGSRAIAELNERMIADRRLPLPPIASERLPL